MPAILSLREAIRPTLLFEAARLSQRIGAQITIASETFQHTGSFKFRAAYNVCLNVSASKIITASSGNFGQGLAYACKLTGKSCIVVMPNTSAHVKVDAVREFGATVDLIDVGAISRQARVSQLHAQHPGSYCASAYDDPFVIEGNASLGAELAGKGFDFVLAPIGGGGLTAGLIIGLRSRGDSVPLLAVEPLIANDAAQSLRAGHIVVNPSESKTIADGVRTVSVGKRNWEIIREGLSEVIEVSEQSIGEGLRLLFNLANLKSEPTGALGIAGLLAQPERFRGKKVCCVVSGGNVDPNVYLSILGGQ